MANMGTMEEWVVPADAKKMWPEVVGLSSEEAKKKIIEDRPDADVHILPPSRYIATMDYRSNRVRVLVDSRDKVIQTPSIG
ncbi:hypothetical protein QYE76_008473 [Lolium multiflorum]|uniref:Uncharacterized protein n=1 Tax=Lolium multiflorum TaxID=4521 RepID=A0AAD8TQ73_LOLMU|nr:hypothetical protein QYE76_008473 [Lolium multiflorum]